MVNKRQFFFNMTAQEYREMMGVSKPAPQKESKYHNHKVEVDGIKFDSKKESKDWKEWKMERRIARNGGRRAIYSKGQHKV